VVDKAKKTLKLAVFDGNSIIHRAFHALPPTMTTRDGKPVNAVFGFTSILLKVLQEIKPTYAIVVWDYPAATFRHAMYGEYKATRQKAPPELYQQIPMVKEVVAALNIPLFEKKEYEADDILGTVAEQAKKFKDLETVLVTGDLDALQLVDARVNVYAMRTGISQTVLYDTKAVEQRFGLGPDQLIEYKALRGDTSDNIPGVRGVGEKTAAALIQDFGSIDALYKKIHETVELQGTEFKKKSIKVAGKLFERLRDQEKQARLSRTLVTINREAPITLDLRAAELSNYDYDKAIKLFSQLQFKSLVARLPKQKMASAPERVLERAVTKAISRPVPVNPNYHLIDTEAKLKNLVKLLSQQKEFALDTETTILGPMGCELVGMSFSFKDGEAYYVPVGHQPHLGVQCARTPAIKLLKPVLENPKIGKLGHNIKYDMVVLKNYGVSIAPVVFDSMIASYLLDPGRRQNSLDALAFNEFGYEMMPIEDCIGVGHKQCSFAEVDIPKATFYAAEDADYTWRLRKPLAEKLEKIPKAMEIFTKIELPLIEVLTEMEFRGVKIDPKLLQQQSKRFARRIVQIKKTIYKQAKGEFNISSPLQLQEVLFQKLGISTEDIKKTKTGYSTAASELEKLRGRHPVIDLISEYRELTKLSSTYLDALPELIEPTTGRVHTSFNQTIAATGRLSSSDPNLQNIPVRTELGNDIRKAFVAERGNILVALDYSQIELRIAAHMSQDPNLTAAFRAGDDIHAATAARVLKKDIHEITKSERNAAKVMNFGIIYGLSAFGMSQRTGMTRQAAGEFIKTYFASYPKLKKYIDELVEEVKKSGYVETLFGRRRYLPEITSNNWQVRAGAERAAVNHPFQGTNADLIKKAMIEIRGKLPDSDQYLIMQVHDELILEVPQKKVAEVSTICKKIMEDVVTLRVPIVVDVKTGDNWGQLEPLDIAVKPK
jgi:DNA polymerase-1